MKKLIKNSLIIIFSLIATLGLNISITRDYHFLQQFDGNNTAWIMVFMFCVIVINRATNIRDKRMMICSIVLSGIFSIFGLLGIFITKMRNNSTNF